MTAVAIVNVYLGIHDFKEFAGKKTGHFYEDYSY